MTEIGRMISDRIRKDVVLGLYEDVAELLNQIEEFGGSRFDLLWALERGEDGKWTVRR